MLSPGENVHGNCRIIGLIDPSVRFQSAKEAQLTLEPRANGAGAELANARRRTTAKPSGDSSGHAQHAMKAAEAKPAAATSKQALQPAPAPASSGIRNRL